MLKTKVTVQNCLIYFAEYMMMYKKTESAKKVHDAFLQHILTYHILGSTEIF